MEIYKNKLSFVAIVKNEAPYIIEWIEFHRLVGVDKFYIYDNESSDNLRNLLSSYIKSGVVVYQYLPGKNMQNKAYTDAVNKYKNETKYMGFIDIDEFVVPCENNSLSDIVEDILNRYPEAAGVAINWRIYGSNGYEKKPEGLVMENYKYRAEDDFDANKHIKTICNPRKVKVFENPHYPIYINSYSVDENGRIIEGPFNIYGTCKKIRINHYFTKSKREYVLKALRGKADSCSFRGMDDFYEHDHDSIYDSIMCKYILSVKKKYDEKMKAYPELSDYTEHLNNLSLKDLINILEKRKQSAYQRIRKTLAQMYDLLSYDIEKNRRR